MKFQTLNLLFKYVKRFSRGRTRDCILSDTECMICSFVAYHAGCSQDDVVKGLHTDKTTVAKAIALLEAKGMVSRAQDTVDHRKKVLNITKHGKNTINAVTRQQDEKITELMSVLTAEEQAQFEEYCLRMLTAADERMQKQQASLNGK